MNVSLSTCILGNRSLLALRRYAMGLLPLTRKPTRSGTYIPILSSALFSFCIILSICHQNKSSELNTIIKRRAKGRAAVVIIRVDAEAGTYSPTKYLVQRKSADYPIKAFQRAVCLLGGNAEPYDKDPLETLTRELGEELPSDLVQSVLSSLKFLGTSMNSQTAEVLQKPEPYVFMCAFYESRISFDQLPSNFEENEGSHALLTKDQLLQEEKYAWGYDSVISTYFGERVENYCKGVAVMNISDNNLKEWTPLV